MSFFEKKEVQTDLVQNGRTLGCTACKLYKRVNSPRMDGYGNFKKKILIVGEAPGETEDGKGKPWQGKMGRKLHRTLQQLGIDLFDDCLSINAVNCHPPLNRDPNPFEIDCCRVVKVKPLIEKYSPKLIICFGNLALQSIIGHKYKKDVGGISKWRGFTIPDYDFGCYIAPTYHPSHVERDGGEPIKTIWKQDIRNALQCINKPLPARIKPNIKIIKDLKVLNKYNEMEFVAFDYETTGLKPHAPGHRIVCTSIAVNPDDVFSFLMPDTKYDRLPFLNLLNDPEIGKRAHNMKFEHAWSLVRLRTEVKNWEWDSMLAAHLFDNRPGITGLKFQTYVNFGVADYSSEIEPYLQGNKKNANSLNRVMELLKTKSDTEKLLHYCGYDSIYEYNLSMKQMELIDYDWLPF